jgi:peptidoglycan/LPS O-acetylase OafA/YrhL
MASTSVAGQRWGAVLILLVLGVLSLPVTAFFFDDDGSENWIVPVAVLLMAVLGAVVGSMLPGLAGPDATPSRGALIGAAVGVAMLVLGIVVFFLLLSGFDGA